LRKIFLVLCVFLTLALGVSATDNEFKNMLLNINVDKIGENAYQIDLVTQTPYADEVKIVKKSDYNYYILLAETYSQPISKKIGNEINPLEVQLFPYVEQGLNNGYTKITLNTTRPLDFTISLKAKGASKFPIMDLVKLAKLDNMFALNQTTVKGGKVLVASAPVTPATLAVKPATPVAAAPITPAKPVAPVVSAPVTPTATTPMTPAPKPVAVAQAPVTPVATATPATPITPAVKPATPVIVAVPAKPVVTAQAPATPAKPVVAAVPATPVTPAPKPTAAAQAPVTPVITAQKPATPTAPVTVAPVQKPVTTVQIPIKEPEPVRLPINVKPLPKPVQPPSTPSYEPQTSVKVAQKPAPVVPVATPVTAPAAAPKVESKAATPVVTPKAAPVPKTAVETPKAVPTPKAAVPKVVEPVKIAQAQPKQATPARPAEEALYKPRQQTQYVPMAPPEEYKPVERQAVQESVVEQPAISEPIAQESPPAPEPAVEHQESQPIAAVPQAQAELPVMERLMLEFENIKNNNPVVLIVLLAAFGLLAIVLTQIARVQSNNKKALLAEKQKMVEQLAQREQQARQAAQRAPAPRTQQQLRQPQQLQQPQRAKQPQQAAPRTQAPVQPPIQTPVQTPIRPAAAAPPPAPALRPTPPMQPASAPVIEPAAGRIRETAPPEIKVEEIIAQVTPQDLAPEPPPQAPQVEIIELQLKPPPKVVDEIDLEGFETFDINFEEHELVAEIYASEPPRTTEEAVTKEIVAQLAPEFNGLPDADSEPAPQPVTLTFEEEEFARPRGAMGPSRKEFTPEPEPQIEEPVAREPEPVHEPEPQEEPEEDLQEAARGYEPLFVQEEPWGARERLQAINEPASISRPPRESLRQRRQADAADILSKVKVEKDRGFYLADYKGVKALVGYIMDDLFVINTFKNKEFKNPQIDFRLSESTHDGDYYLVKVDNSTMLVKSQKDEMSLEGFVR